MTQSTSAAPLRVVIVGGGIAALEVVLALHDLAAEHLDVVLIAPEPDFTLRPAAVAAPFSRGHAARLPLTRVMAEHDGRFVRGAVARVDAAARTVTLTSGAVVTYDALVLAPGASAVPAFSRALTFGAHPRALNGILADLEEGWSRSVAFVVPPGCSWPLPIYELALMTAQEVWSMSAEVAIHVVTPELAPLDIFGPEGSAAVAGLLDAAGITVHPGVEAQIHHTGRLDISGEAQLVVDCVVALPLLEGPRLSGIPCDADGFIAVDDVGLVHGLECVYAVGDATDRPIKQGGLACQQADVAAAHIAVRAGADIEIPPLQQVLRGRLMTGAGDQFLQGRERASNEPLLWAPAKVSGEHISPYLIAQNVVDLPIRADASAPGVDVSASQTSVRYAGALT
ncbi:MAG TPA: FAD-dependent oxidoreductase [Solirubrobacteraceae bacterium]|nr:FAD-dependent oxidoreductase [Solirubrobacteraceae bacterium]